MNAIRCAALACLIPFAGMRPAVAQLPTLGTTATGRFVDFSKDLADAGVVVVVGPLGKWKEGKRERLADGTLGGAGATSSVSGTQYFKVPVQAAVQVRRTFQGKADKPVLGFDVQLARLPDGKEQRQLMTSNAAKLEEGTLAMFVLRERAKGKGYDLVHAIPFARELDKQKDAEAGFVDTMHDFYVVNRYVADLELALQRLDGAAQGKEREDAAKAVKKVLDERPELKQHENDVLWGQHAGTLEQRAKKRLDEVLPAKVETPASEGGK